MKCPKCKFETASDSSFCPHCGTKIGHPQDQGFSQTRTIAGPEERFQPGRLIGGRYKLQSVAGRGVVTTEDMVVVTKQGAAWLPKPQKDLILTYSGYFFFFAEKVSGLVSMMPLMVWTSSPVIVSPSSFAFNPKINSAAWVMNDHVHWSSCPLIVPSPFSSMFIRDIVDTLMASLS